VFRRTVQAAGVTPADYVNSVSEAGSALQVTKKSVAQQKATIAETKPAKFFFTTSSTFCH